MFEFFTKNNLISDNQSGFTPGDSCVNQLLSITHEIYQSFDDNLEVRAAFLDISKAFDKVWHKGPIYELKQNGISGSILNTIIDFLSFRKQRVALNGQVSQWTSIEVGVPQGSILGPLLFLIYINDLYDDLSTNPKLFASDTFLFSIVHDINTSAAHLNNDLRKISNWAFQWKMSFNPDPSKQAQEVIFSRKHEKISHPSIYFNNNPIESVSSQKHLGIMILDTKLNFLEHIKNILTKVNKTIGLLRKLQNILPRRSLLTIFKSFVRPHLDYGDVIYDQSYNNTFHQKMESIQYNAALAITGATRGSSREKLYQELGLESLQQRRWYRKLCYFFKLTKNKSPKYLFNNIPTVRSTYRTRNIDNIPQFNIKHTFFRNSYFLSIVTEWNNLGKSIRDSESFSVFNKNILKFIRPSPNSILNCHNSKGVKLLTRLRLGLSHLHDHKFKHSFQDSLNPICNYGTDVETTTLYLLHCPLFSDERLILINNIRNIDNHVLNLNNSNNFQKCYYLVTLSLIIQKIHLL